MCTSVPNDFAFILSNHLPMLTRDLATEFEVAESTINRWANGTANPHPTIQRQVMQSLFNRGFLLPGEIKRWGLCQ